MFNRRLTIPIIAASLALTPATRVAADAGDALAGALVGGIIGHAIARDQQRRTTTVQRTYRRAPGISSAERQSNREMQNALNYFGFNAGSVDGAVGPGTRSAVSRYQAFMSYPASGYIQSHERDMLLSAFNWATSGGAATVAATTPQGLLTTYRQQMAGVGVQGQMPYTVAQPQYIVPPTTVVVAPPAPAPTAPAPVEVTAEVEPQIEAEPAPSLALLPNFMGGGESESLASHCNKVSLLTNTNGGFTKAATMTDAGFALEEQFCLARTYAISDGEEIAGRLSGFTPQQLAAQCGAFGPAMRDHIASLSLKPRDEVLQSVSAFALGSGIAPQQLAGTAKVCLSVGYRTDDMDVALASALLLVALGQPGYAELMGHHLSQGFGASERPDLALAWYEMGLDATGNGTTAVFAPGQPERSELIRKAAFTIVERDGAAATPAPAPTQASATVLPTFAINN